MRLQETLSYLLNNSAKLLKRNIDARLKNYGITISQYAVLRLLSENDDLSQADIADRMNIDRANCGTILDKLIAKGLVKKELSKTDRRSYRVKILPPALAIVNEFASDAEEVSRMITKDLSEEDIQALERDLRTIIANIEDDER